MRSVPRLAFTGVVTALLLLLPLSGQAQTEPTTAGTASGIRLEIPDDAAAGPDFDVDRATQAYLDLLSPEAREKSTAYANGGYWMSLAGFLYGLLVAWLLLGTRLSVRMRGLAERITGWRNVHVLVYAVQYTLITTILTFPWSVYEGFIREHRFDLATQTFPEWAADQAKGLVIGLILGSLALMLIYAVVRRWPQRWWQGATVAAVGLVIFSATISPVYISPLFNDYKPLEGGPIRDRILAMARANGVPATNVYWFDASKQTTRISANVSGLLGTTRISLNDNLLNGTSPEEIEAVMAHELGHYVLNHGWESIIYMSMLIAAGFAFLSWGFERARRRWGDRWGIRNVADPAGLPLAAALMSVYFFAATPVLYAIVRTNELEADQFGLNAARQPDGFARVAIRLSTYRKIEPSVWEEALLYHHPSGRTRVRTAMEWKKENLEIPSPPRPDDLTDSPAPR